MHLVRGSYGPPCRVRLYRGFPKITGTLFGGPYNKDYRILGSIMGPLIYYHIFLMSAVLYVKNAVLVPPPKAASRVALRFLWHFRVVRDIWKLIETRFQFLAFIIQG